MDEYTETKVHETPDGYILKRTSEWGRSVFRVMDKDGHQRFGDFELASALSKFDTIFGQPKQKVSP